jgi:hypothetical protein
MKKLFLMPIIILFLTSCSRDEYELQPCLTKTCAYELLSELDLDGFALGTTNPNPDFFTADQYLYQNSVSDMRQLMRLSLGFNRNQMDAFVSTISANPDLIVPLIESNKSTIKNLLKFSNWDDRLLYWYNSANYWVTNKNLELSEDFEGFFQEHGHLNVFPSEWSNGNEAEDFHDDMNDIIESYPEILSDDGRYGYAPEKYKSWLLVRRWKERIGIDNIHIIMDMVEDLL